MNKSLQINFILPFKPRRPAGGFRIMYEYANRLSLNGHIVHITYPIRTKFMNYRLPYPIRYALSKIEGFRTDKWFDFNPTITKSYVPEVKEEYVIDADVVIATWWSTVLDMGALSDKKGKKINLIQGYENWEGHEDLLFKSYNLPSTTNIIVASYLKEIVEKHTKKRAILIHNSINFDVFNAEMKIEDRNPKSIIMHYSDQTIKGSEFGIKALSIVKERYPDISVDFFSVSPQPEGLVSWINYHRSPSNLPELYNKNAIFISNSLTEGFPLVAAEALSCGCALICTDIAGHKEFAFDNETALLVETKNPDDMTDKICKLIEDNELRIKLAKQGNKYIHNFNWKNAIDKMENIITEITKKDSE